MYDLIIIGGGPAGLAASVYAARKLLKTLLISADIGGQVNWTMGIENYLGYQFIEGPELIEKFYTQMSQFPIEQRIGARVEKITRQDGAFEAVTASGERYQAKAVIFAAGKSPRRLDVPGEKEYTGKGVSYCVVCDGPIFAEKRVAIIGGGNSALGAALDMVKIAAYVELISLTPLTGDPILVAKLRDAPNLTVRIGYTVERIEGDSFVRRILVKNAADGKQNYIDVSGVFVEVGLTPNSTAVEGLVEINELGEVLITCACETNVPGLYAAGDVTNVPEKQIIIAAGEGVKAALQAHGYLQRLS